MNEKVYDLIIVGGGPAALTAAIYTSRENIKTLILEKSMCGGLAGLADFIENYPGFPEGIKGYELADRFKKQAVRFGTHIVEASQVTSIEEDSGYKIVQTKDKQYKGKALILATGTVPRKLNISGEAEFSGRGVSYCATCDGPLFRNKEIYVIGGGDTAVKGANFLTKFTDKVTLVHRRDKLRASLAEQERILNNKKVSILWSHIPISIEGENKVESVVLKDLVNDKEVTKTTEGIFIFAGYVPHTEFLKGFIQLNERGYIKTDENMRTSLEGVFAAGDIRDKRVKQVSTACGDGTVAAMSVRDYLQSTEEKK